MKELAISPKKTALVIIDMQESVVKLSLSPHSNETVVKNVVCLANACRAAGIFVVLVHVDTRDNNDMLQPITDQAPTWKTLDRSVDWAKIIPQLGPQSTDHLVTKHQWGAFYGTDLDLQLRRRGIDTIVLCGIATPYGVDTTAREAYQHGYQQVFAEDAMSAPAPGQHEFVCQHIFPRIGRLRLTEEIIGTLG